VRIAFKGIVRGIAESFHRFSNSPVSLCRAGLADPEGIGLRTASLSFIDEKREMNRGSFAVHFLGTAL
jgi:hypothetical protein